MNLRDVMKKVRSPGGKTFIGLLAVVAFVLLALPVLMRDSGGFNNPAGDSSKDSFEITGRTRAVGSQRDNIRVEDPVSETPIPRPEPSGDPGRRMAPLPTTPRTERETGRQAAEPEIKLITLIDGESGGAENSEFLSERYAPYGRLLSCKMTNTVESGNVETPLIAVVIEDLWWINQHGEKKLIIPAGTEVHGTVQGAKPLRNRLTTGNEFVLVWQATSDMVGFELKLNGIALEKSTHLGDKSMAAISDMSAGIPGQVISNENLSKILMYTLAFGQGLAQGYQTTEAYAAYGDVVVTQEGTNKNALARGSETLAQLMLQDISDMVAKESYFIRVPSGTEFYLFVRQVINLDDAKVANTLLTQLENEKINGGRSAANPTQPGSHREVLSAFSK